MQSMIAIALLALCLGISVESFRSSRASGFEFKASLHADLEVVFREEEQRWIEYDIPGLAGGQFSKKAAAAAAKADFHAAMKRKYAQAATSRVFSVEPDPSSPP